jgi:hypothetical protein
LTRKLQARVKLHYPVLKQGFNVSGILLLAFKKMACTWINDKMTTTTKQKDECASLLQKYKAKETNLQSIMAKTALGSETLATKMFMSGIL